MAEFRLAVDDSIELAEMLTFLDDWLAGAGPGVTQSFSQFVGSDGYSVEELRSDLDRFISLLGGSPVSERTVQAEPF